MAATKTQLRKKRGRYSYDPRVLGSPDEEQAYHEGVARIAADYYQASTLEDRTAAHRVADQLARLEAHLQRFSEMEARAQLTGDEARTWPSISREIRELRDTLGIMKLEEQEDF